MTTAAPTPQHQLRQHIYDGVPAPLDDKGKPMPLYIAIFSGQRKSDGSKLHSETTRYFEWPRQSAEATRYVQREMHQREMYQCAHLLTSRRRVKANAAQMMALYVDGDGAQPGPDLPQPTATIESSPGRQQFYWRLTRPIDPVIGEQLNRRLANAMQADMSGWDLTQVLRPPGTHNHKYEERPTVEIVSIDDDLSYDPDDLHRILPPLPAEASPRAEVKLEHRPAAPISDRDQRARERMYAGKRGSEIQHLANGGKLSEDASGDDQSYANGLAFWFDKDPARMAAEMERSGRVRDKWYEIHSAKGETYLEMTIGTAIGSCSQTFRELRGHDAGDDPPQIQVTAPEQPITANQTETGASIEPMTLESALARIAYLERGNLDRDDRLEMMTGIIADQQQVICAERERRKALEEFVTTVDTVMANPDLSATDKVVSFVITRDLHTRLSQGRKTIALARIADQTGMHKNTVGKSVDRLSTGEGAPFQKARLRNAEKEKELGHPVLDLYITPRGDSARDTLAAVASYVAPEDRPKHGGSQQAAEARERTRRGCVHENDAVMISGCCAACGEVLGDQRITADEWEALKHQLGVSGIPPAPVDVPVPMGHQVGVSDAPPTSLFDYVPARRQRRPDRCPAPGCTAMEFRPHPDGSWRCLRSAHDPRVYDLAAVAGGSE